ncbi:MAG: ABC transporter permease [Candidatus Humimicrobiaceae bacterium]
MKNGIKYKIISVISVLVFIGIWELLTDVLKVLPSYTMPSPYAVAKEFISKLYEVNPDGGTLFQHIYSSMKVALTGFIMGSIIGVALGVLMAWYKKVDMIVRPLFDLLRPISPIAWIPLLILWLGIGLLSKASIIFITVFIVCVINSYTGIKQTSAVHIWVAETFGATKFEVLRKVAFPSALPQIFIGLRIALGAAWMSLVAAELLAADKGLGYMLDVARFLGRPDIIVVGMLTIGGIGALLSFLLGFLEHKYVRGGI